MGGLSMNAQCDTVSAMKPSNAPLSAIPIPPPQGPFPAVQVSTIDGITAEVLRETTVAKTNWDGACQNWTLANSRKPDPFVPTWVQTAPDTESQTGVVWLWIQGGSPIVCPDLPAPQTPVGPNHIHIGSHLYGNFWTAAQDNTFNDTGDIPGTSDDGVTGTWQFVGSAMGAGKGWYLKK